MHYSDQARVIPISIGTIHIIGIGGIGMSAIAEILHHSGYKVQGSDMAESANVTRLRDLGIKVFVPQQASNIDLANVIVRSTAVKDDNAEVKAARERGIPVLRRDEMLKEVLKMKATISLAGSHGKTTTTSLTAHLFEKAELEPTVINGGIIVSKGTNAYLGNGNWMIVEADESDGTFVTLPSIIGVVTNIDPEHLDYYQGSYDKLKSYFTQFLQGLPFYGFGVICADDATVLECAQKVENRTLYRYSTDTKLSAKDAAQKQIDIWTTQIELSALSSHFSVALSPRLAEILGQKEIKDITLNTPGLHNVSNVLSVIAIGIALGMDAKTIQTAFADFGGVKRRFTHVGKTKNEITIIDDYAHHPKEIAATLKVAKNFTKERGGKVVAVCQPHRYSRVRDAWQEFGECFENADVIAITDIFSAGEAPLDGISQENLIQSIKKHLTAAQHITPISSQEALAKELLPYLAQGDIVVLMGAGTITYWAATLSDELDGLFGKKAVSVA